MNIEPKDVTGQIRTCKSCQETKDLKEGFRYSPRYDCYEHTCKLCRAKETKDKRSTTILKTKEDCTLTSKTCVVCQLEKDIKDFPFHKPTGYYLNTCQECKNTQKREDYKKLPEEKKEEKRFYFREQRRTTEDKTAIIYQRCTNYDQKKGLTNNLTIDFIREHINDPCIYCGFPSTGLDRLDNSIGHSKENCVPCCRDCNIARSNHFSFEEMKVIGIAIGAVKTLRQQNNQDIIRDYYHKGN